MALIAGEHGGGAAAAAGPGRVSPVNLWPFPGGTHRFIVEHIP